MKEPRCIRYFYYEENAVKACEYVKRLGFECYFIEDKFEKLTLDKLGMRRRFKLMVERIVIFKIEEVLERKLKKSS